MKKFNPNDKIVMRRLNEATSTKNQNKPHKKQKSASSMFLSNTDFDELFAEQDRIAAEKANEVNEEDEKKRIHNTMAAIKTLFVDNNIPFTLYDPDKEKHFMNNIQIFMKSVGKIFTDMFVNHKGNIIMAIDLTSSPNFQDNPIYKKEDYLRQWPFSKIQKSKANSKMTEMERYIAVNKLKNGHVMLQIAITDDPKVDFPFMVAFAAGVYSNKSDYELNKNFIK